MTISPIRHICWICGKEVSLETSKTDEKGHMVHEACYALRMQLRREAEKESSEPKPQK